jgi:hypothetical protein
MPLPRTRDMLHLPGGDQHLRLVLAGDAKLIAGLAEEGSALGEDYAGHFLVLRTKNGGSGKSDGRFLIGQS